MATNQITPSGERQILAAIVERLCPENWGGGQNEHQKQPSGDKAPGFDLCGARSLIADPHPRFRRRIEK